MAKDTSNMSAEELERYQRQISHLKPFRKAEELTEEEREKQRALVTKGAYARTEKQRAKKNLKETALGLLETEISKAKAKEWIGDKADLLPDDNLTVQAVLTVALADSLLRDGNAKAFEVLRDTSGQKPKDEINLTADIMTAADRALLDKVSARITETDVKSPENDLN